MFHAPKETVGGSQELRLPFWNQFQLGEDREGLERVRFLQESVPRSVQELERLHDKFDFTNSAGAQFDVAIDIFVTDDVSLDPPFQRENFIEQIRRGAPRVNEGLMLAKKFVSEFAAATNSSRLDEREPFPGFTEAGIIIFHALERAREGASRSFGPKPEIDPKERPGRIRSRKGFSNFGSEQVEPFVVSEARRNLPFVAVKEDDVDIGTMIQFAAAQFSQPKNREIGLRSAAAVAQLGVPVSVNFSQANFRQERQLERRFLQGGGLSHFTQRDPDHFASLPKPKRAKVFGGNRITSGGLQFGQHFALAARRGTDRRTVQPKKDLGMSHQARGADA